MVLAVILHVAHIPLKDLPPEESSHFLMFFSHSFYQVLTNVMDVVENQHHY